MQKKKLGFNIEIGEMPVKETKEGEKIQLKVSRTYLTERKAIDIDANGDEGRRSSEGLS